jgi:hypothetical protein
MSNRAVIQQETRIIYKTNQAFKSIVIFDDYNYGSILLDDFFEDDMELLEFVLKTLKEGNREAVDSVLSNVYENEHGLEIENTWYDWKDVEPVFIRVWDLN